MRIYLYSLVQLIEEFKSCATFLHVLRAFVKGRDTAISLGEVTAPLQLRSCLDSWLLQFSAESWFRLAAKVYLIKAPRSLQGRKERTHPERARLAGSLAQSHNIVFN